MATTCGYRPLLRVATVLLLLSAASCGGSSSGSPAPTVPGATTLDAVYPTSLASPGGTTSGTGSMYLGEYWDNSDIESRIAFVFDLTSLPPGSVVTGASLMVYVASIQGGASNALPAVLDHDARSTVASPSGGSGGDFDGTFDDMSITQVNTPGVVPNEPTSWTVDVTSVVSAARASGASSSVFRMRGTAVPIVNGAIDAYLVGGTWVGDMQTWNPTLHIEYLAP